MRPTAAYIVYQLSLEDIIITMCISLQVTRTNVPIRVTSIELCSVVGSVQPALPRLSVTQLGSMKCAQTLLWVLVSTFLLDKFLICLLYTRPIWGHALSNYLPCVTPHSTHIW